MRALFRGILERAGHVVHESAEGLKGIRCLHEWSMDVVITDIHLPDCDGLEVIASLRQEFPAVKIVAVSARPGHEDALVTSKLLGADAVLQDALDGVALLNVVDQLRGDRKGRENDRGD